jgi:hypothetical protein
MFGCLFLGRLLNPGRGGKDPNLPVGKNSVYIEQNKLDLLGPLLRHGRILAFGRRHSSWWQMLPGGARILASLRISSRDSR